FIEGKRRFQMWDRVGRISSFHHGASERRAGWKESGLDLDGVLEPGQSFFGFLLLQQHVAQLKIQVSRVWVRCYQLLQYGQSCVQIAASPQRGCEETLQAHVV